jgi:uncharacterized protein
MPTAINIEIGKVVLKAEINDSESARIFLAALPRQVSLSRWGDEYYGNCGIKVDEADDAREEMKVGELALWPPGNALCIFFGPTPASRGKEPRAASPVNPLGKLVGDVAALKGLGPSIRAKVSIV